VSGDSTRWTVIQRAAEGSAADRDEFARRYAPVVRAYLGARWRGTPLAGEVEDGAQQVFLDCFKEDGALTRIDRGRGSGFRAYLYGVARNVALSMERKRARSKERQADLDAHASNDASCARVFDRAWASAVLRDAVEHHLALARAKGPEALRRHRLLLLRHGEDLPLREIAARWEVERELLYREYRKAREEFRRALVEVVRELQGGGRENVDQEVERLAALFG
jgi:RNA polymerase sigma factor (sigma-70 family)